MSSLIGIFALGVLSLVVMLLPLWQRRADRSLGSGIETDDIVVQWELEKDRLVKEQHDLDIALAEGKIPEAVHRVEREQVVSDAKRALERLRQARSRGEGLVAAAKHKPRAYPKYGAVLGSLILVASLGLTFYLDRQDVVRQVAQPKQPGEQNINMADIEKMVRSLETRVQAGGSSLREQTMLARSYLVLGRRDDAIALYENIRSQDEDNMVALMALGEIYFNSKDKGDWGKALGYFEQALSLQPDKPEALWYKSLGLVRERKLDEARVVLAHLKVVAKDNEQAQAAVTQLLAELDKNRAAQQPGTPKSN